jgi:hypothetical protein
MRMKGMPPFVPGTSPAPTPTQAFECGTPSTVPFPLM